MEEGTSRAITQRRRKTNSERGKEFRAKRKDYERHLQEIIRSLRDEVLDLSVLRDIRRDRSLVTRSSMDGSLVRLVTEYFSLFARGRPSRPHIGGKRESPSATSDLLARQASFVNQCMDPDMKFGADGRGVLLDQWERYTLYHSSFQISVVSVEVTGPDESPIITVTSQMRVKLSRKTFKHIFPHVADNEDLVARLVGREVTYRGVNQFEFSNDGKRILVYESEVDFVNAFFEAGISLSDVALLMKEAYIADQYLLGEEPHANSTIEEIQDHETSSDEPSTEPEESDCTSTGGGDFFKKPRTQDHTNNQTDRQRIDFLLN